MIQELPRPVLKGKKALIAGIANEYSIAYGCASAFRELGADLAITYLNEKARPHVEPLAQKLDAPIFVPLNVTEPGELEAVFARIEREWGDWTSWSIPSPSPRRRICRVVCSIAPPKDSPRRWTSPATPSSAWRSSPRR